MTNLALIGKGSWGKNYIRTIRNLSDCYLPDRNIKTRDYKQLLSHTDIDGVIIATPAKTHFSIAKQFLLKNIPVLIEKPVTTDVQEADELMRLSKKADIVAMAGHIFLYNPAFLAAKRILPNIGTIRSIIATSGRNGVLDVSALWDWGPHDISQILFLLESYPSSVAAWGMNMRNKKHEPHDLSVIRLVFPNDISVVITVGWCMQVSKREMTILGEKGAIVFDDLALKKVTWIDLTGKTERISYLSYDAQSPLESEVLAFVHAIKKREQPLTDLTHAQKVTTILAAAERSMACRGKSIDV